MNSNGHVNTCNCRACLLTQVGELRASLNAQRVVETPTTTRPSSPEPPSNASFSLADLRRAIATLPQTGPPRDPTTPLFCYLGFASAQYFNEFAQECGPNPYAFTIQSWIVNNVGRLSRDRFRLTLGIQPKTPQSPVFVQGHLEPDPHGYSAMEFLNLPGHFRVGATSSQVDTVEVPVHPERRINGHIKVLTTGKLGSGIVLTVDFNTLKKISTVAAPWPLVSLPQLAVQIVPAPAASKYQSVLHYAWHYQSDADPTTVDSIADFEHSGIMSLSAQIPGGLWDTFTLSAPYDGGLSKVIKSPNHSDLHAALSLLIVPNPLPGMEMLTDEVLADVYLHATIRIGPA